MKRMKSNWMDYVAFNAITYGVVNASEVFSEFKELDFDTLRLDDGARVDLGDKGLQALFRAINLEDVSETTKLSALRKQLGAWNANNHPKGPGQYDVSAIGAFREVCDEHGWAGVDLLMLTLFGAKPSRVFAEPRTILDLNDPGIDGPNCYSLVLKVRTHYSQTSWSDIDDKWRVVGSTPKSVITHMEALISGHYAQAKDGNRRSQATRSADLAVAGVPYWIEIRKNGDKVASLRLVENETKTGMDIRWETAFLKTDDRDFMLAFTAIAPVDVAKKIKGSFLQDELGI
jgi:hypothetical protein